MYRHEEIKLVLKVGISVYVNTVIHVLFQLQKAAIKKVDWN